jgi:hypothetical protein
MIRLWIVHQETVSSPLSLEDARQALKHLRERGVAINGDHRSLFGFVSGDRFSLSFGLPLVDGRSPVLRGVLVPHANGVDARMTAGMRIEMMIGFALVGLFGFVFGGYQIGRELTAPTGTLQAHMAGALDVLPRMGIILAPLAFFWWLWLRSEKPVGALLARIVAMSLKCEDTAASTPGRGPIDA